MARRVARELDKILDGSDPRQVAIKRALDPLLPWARTMMEGSIEPRCRRSAVAGLCTARHIVHREVQPTIHVVPWPVDGGTRRLGWPVSRS